MTRSRTLGLQMGQRVSRGRVVRVTIMYTMYLEQEVEVDLVRKSRLIKDNSTMGSAITLKPVNTNFEVTRMYFFTLKNMIFLYVLNFFY